VRAFRSLSMAIEPDKSIDGKQTDQMARERSLRSFSRVDHQPPSLDSLSDEEPGPIDSGQGSLGALPGKVVLVKSRREGANESRYNPDSRRAHPDEQRHFEARPDHSIVWPGRQGAPLGRDQYRVMDCAGDLLSEDVFYLARCCCSKHAGITLHANRGRTN
jgi:hypothetical protein